jgi:hypothetical protein
VALHLGREDMITFSFENTPSVFQYVALKSFIKTTGSPAILNLFRGNGNDAQRSAILSLVVQDSEILEFMKSSKREIARYICWKRHEELFVNAVKQLAITSEDICAEGGMSSN